MPVMDENRINFNGITLSFNYDDYTAFLDAINTDAAKL